MPLAPPATRNASRTITKRDVRDVVRDAIVEAFYAAHDGYSIDWLLAKPQLQAAFHEACREAGLIGGPADWNRELLRLRKTGGFPKRGQIKKVHVADDELDAYSFAAEIAWRLTSDKFDGPSLDEIFCDPRRRRTSTAPPSDSRPASSRRNIAGPRCGSAKPAATWSTK